MTLCIANRMLGSGAIESTLIITDRLVQDHWRDVAKLTDRATQTLSFVPRAFRQGLHAGAFECLRMLVERDGFLSFSVAFDRQSASPYDAAIRYVFGNSRRRVWLNSISVSMRMSLRS